MAKPVDDKRDEHRSMGNDKQSMGLSSSLVNALDVTIYAIVGSRVMTVAQIAKLKPGAVVQLDKTPKGSLVDLYANNTLFARAELVSSEEGLGIKIVELHENS